MNVADSNDRQRAADAYVECAVWADWPRSDDGEELDATLTLEGERRLVADLYTFLDDPAVAEDVSAIDAEQVGHDFWLTRNGHGAGFWDRGLGAIGERLTQAAHVYGEEYLDGFLEWPAEVTR